LSTISSTPTHPTSLTLDRLLSAGYLPEVLPPCFNSESFGKAFGTGKSPHAFFKNCPKVGKTPPVIPTSSKCVHYNQARVGGARRLFSIPNPVHFFRLASCFFDNWASIEPLARASKISLTRPILSNGKRAFRHEVNVRDRPLHRARVRSTARFILRTDISRFFPSIYTHSIPWAIHTKARAKGDRSDSLYGNQLDKHFRNLQDAQTIGIPIGQDISRVIAEIILGDVESKMGIKKWPAGMRCIDDYEIGFLSHAEASEFQHKLEGSLRDFELAINPMKTAIRGLPQLLIDRWDAELRQFDFGVKPPDPDEDDDESGTNVAKAAERPHLEPTKEQLLLFFNRAIDLQAQNKDQAVLRFSVRRLAHLKMNGDCWPIYQDYLLNCALNQPETLRLVVSGLLKARFLDRMLIDKKRLRTVINEIIVKSAPVGHASDVAWALWAALVFQIKIGREAARALQEFRDSIVGCLAFEARTKNLLPRRFELQWLNDLLASPDAFYSEHWLLAYEAVRNNWISTPPALDLCFSYLKQEGVSFFVAGHAEKIRKELMATRKKPRPEQEEDDDGSDSEDAFDNWWFDDED
jgi:hypothetical protein